jgi:hypothetical protein
VTAVERALYHGIDELRSDMEFLRITLEGHPDLVNFCTASLDTAEWYLRIARVAEWKEGA